MGPTLAQKAQILKYKKREKAKAKRERERNEYLKLKADAYGKTEYRPGEQFRTEEDKEFDKKNVPEGCYPALDI